MANAIAPSVIERLNNMSPQVIDFFSLATDNSDSTLVKMARHPAFDEANNLLEDALAVLIARGPAAIEVAALLNSKVPHWSRRRSDARP